MYVEVLVQTHVGPVIAAFVSVSSYETCPADFEFLFSLCLSYHLALTSFLPPLLGSEVGI